MPAVGRASSKPKSLVDHLNDQAPKRPVNESVSISRYLFSAKLLLNQASEYRGIGDEEQLYVILLRYASLVVETIPKHRDFSSGNPDYVKLKRELLERFLPELERIKASLRLKDRAEPPAAVSRNRPADAVQLSVSSLPQLNWATSGAPSVEAAPGAAAVSAGSAAAGSSAGFAGSPALQIDDLLEVMQGPPKAALGSSPPAGPPALRPAAPGPGLGAGGTPGGSPSDPYALAAAASASLGMAQLKYSKAYASSSGRHALFGQSSSGRAAADGQRLTPAMSMPRYPALDTSPVGAPSAVSAASAPAPAPAAPDIAQLSISPLQQQQSEQVVQLSMPQLQLQELQQQQLRALAMPQPSAGPSLGPQEVAVFNMPPSTAGLPDTCSMAHGSYPPPPPPPPSSAPAPPSAPALPAPGGPKEIVKRAQMRDVHVSVSLMEEFLRYARANTSRGIESCGILAGKLLAGDSTFAISTLIIPKQQGSTDTVQALNEEEIFEAQFERELYPLGWIHTHPTQTCFLSSVDVHTQCGYQTMLDEAVAIVMAPTDATKRCGIFRLSTPGGLGLVQKCPNRGFHMHPPTETGQELYELCGHVFLNPRSSFEVLDLR